MKFNQLIETIRILDNPINEAATPKSPEMTALLKQRSTLVKQLQKIDNSIRAQEQNERNQRRDQLKRIPNADKTLSELWRKHFDAYEASEVLHDSQPEWKYYNKILIKLYDKVEKLYGNQMAEDMATHSEMLERANGPKALQKTREYRNQHGVSDEYFDPDDELDLY